MGRRRLEHKCKVKHPVEQATHELPGRQRLGDNEHAVTEADALADKEAVIMILDSVSSPAREILRLRFSEDRSLNQIAASLNISLSAAKIRLYRALDQFRARYPELEELSHSI